MGKIDINKGLTKWANETENLIRYRILETNTVDTGDLYDSVGSRVAYSGGTGEWTVNFTMLDYGKFTDLPPGKGGSSFIKKEPVPPRNFFHKVIKDQDRKLEDYIEDDIYLSIDRIMSEKITGSNRRITK